jgi:hypothetical protein
VSAQGPSGASGADCPGRVRLLVHDVRHADTERASSGPLLGIVGDLDVEGDEMRLITLSELPVVELAQQVDRWLIGLGAEGPDFIYTSLTAADEPGLLYFHAAVPCWRVGSVRAAEDREITTSLRAVTAAAGEYVAMVERLVRPLGVDLPRFLRDQAR